jgi:hypothetical protein
MFIGFHHENFSIKADGGAVSKESFFHQFLATREMDPLDMLCQNPNSVFGKFCTSKYLVVVHPKLEASFFGNLDQRNYKKKGRASKNALLPGLLETGQVDLAFSQACLFL